MMMGTLDRARSSRHTSIPDTFGSMTSSSTTSGLTSSNTSSASAPSRATWTVKPSRSSPTVSASMKESSSSTTRTEVVGMAIGCRLSRFGRTSSGIIAADRVLPGPGTSVVSNPIVGTTAGSAGKVALLGLRHRDRTGQGREAEGEGRALAHPGVDVDHAFVVVDDVADDGEPEAGPARLAAAGVVDAVEPLEHPLEVARRDADAVVDHRDPDALAVGARAHLDDRAAVGVLHGVVEQVREGGHELAPVAEQSEAGVGLGDVEGDARLLGGGQEAGGGLATICCIETGS